MYLFVLYNHLACVLREFDNTVLPLDYKLIVIQLSLGLILKGITILKCSKLIAAAVKSVAVTF